DSGSIVNIVRLLSARVEEKRPPPFEHVDALAHVCNYWSSDRDHRARAACRGASRAWRTVRRSCWSSLAPASTAFAPRRLVLLPLYVRRCYCGEYRSRSNKTQQRILKLI